MKKLLKSIFAVLVFLNLISCTETSGILGDPSPFVTINFSSISGVIIDSQTGQGLANALVSLTLDFRATTGAGAAYQTVTAQDGSYSITNVPNNSYRLIVEANGYFTSVSDNVTVEDGVNRMEQQTVVQQPALNSIRIVLTWGALPRDLDTHFTGPLAAGDRFHIYYSRKSQSGAGASLDVDDTSSYGPETVTIQTLVDGTYRYSVYNFSEQSTTGGSGIASSSAKVDVYNHSGLLNSFTPPVFTGNGNTWRIFEMVVSGTSISVNPINTYVMASSSSDIATFVKKSTDTETVHNNIDKKPQKYNMAEW